MATALDAQKQAKQEQDKLLEDSSQRVQAAGYQMTRALDRDEVSDAIQHASVVIGELRTGKLSPQGYYELYMKVCDQLSLLEQYFQNASESKSSFSIVDMYEKVQHQEKILPRLYLLITVAAVYIKSKKAPAKDILFDLVELSRGVQHPMRGLFLRNYLSSMSKDKLPDINSTYHGDPQDSIEFILQNFGEMNKLWVRMQHQGAFKTMSRRETERKNLRQLVGTNLVRLSEMRGVDLEAYRTVVLPRILEQVINCKDVIAQHYLMDCIIQVFPDEFHLANLETFLSTCSQLSDGVNVKDILRVLMNRIANYAKECPENIPSNLEMFPLFHKYSSQIIEAKQKRASTDSPLKLGEDVLPLQVALVNFAASCYPERLSYVDDVLDFSVKQITAAEGSMESDEKAVDSATQLLSMPLDSISLKILELRNYAPLLTLLPAESRKRVAIAISLTASKSPSPIETNERADALFKYLSPLIVEDIKVTPENRFEFEQEQHAVAQLFQLIRSDSSETHFEMYNTARRYFGRGGEERIEFTLPPLVINSLQLCERTFADGEAKRTKQVFGFIHETIQALTRPYPELALRLYLMAATCSLKCNFEPIAYEFVAQAFVTYEDQISDSKAQFLAITHLAGCLQQLTGFNAENYDTLISKCAQHSAKLMLKPQSCRAVYTCSHLFWTGSDENPAYRDEKKVLACLKRSLKIANSCMGEQVPMFIEILNKYLYFFDRECPSITARYLQNLIELIDEHIQSSETSSEAQRHYENTLDHIKYKQGLADRTGARYREISEAASGDAGTED